MVTDKDLLGDRERIIAQIRQLQAQLKENEIALRVFSRVKTGRSLEKAIGPLKRVSEDIPSQYPDPKLSPDSQSKVAARAMSGVVRRAIFAQTDQFDSTMIVGYVQKYHPEVAKRLPPSLVATILWRLSNDGELKVLRLRKNGAKRLYALSKMT